MYQLIMPIKCFYELLQQTYGHMKPVDLPNKTTSNPFYYDIYTTHVLWFVYSIYLTVFSKPQRVKQNVIIATGSRCLIF